MLARSVDRIRPEETVPPSLSADAQRRCVGTRPRPPRNERGAVAVEAAFVGTLLFGILSGVVDTSVLFRTTYEVSSASRAGARLAAAQPMATNFARDSARQVVASMAGLDYTRITRLWVYRADPDSPTGEPASGSEACGTKCVSFSVSSRGAITRLSGSWSGRNACAGGVVDTVGVRVQYRNDAPITFGDDRLVQETTVMRLEQISSGAVCVSS
ncbi:MAG: TadE/TadG family type IV pilus assembly protein [Dermatophilaceae bacterium]